MKPLLLRGGRVVDPSQDQDGLTDLLLLDGKIAGLGASLAAPDGADIIDVSGKVVAPGLVDVHVHLREPGNESAETIATGARAAAAGGFTSVCAMPNTDPVVDNEAAVGFAVKQADAAQAIDEARADGRKVVTLLTSRQGTTSFFALRLEEV